MILYDGRQEFIVISLSLSILPLKVTILVMGTVSVSSLLLEL